MPTITNHAEIIQKIENHVSAFLGGEFKMAEHAPNYPTTDMEKSVQICKFKCDGGRYEGKVKGTIKAMHTEGVLLLTYKFTWVEVDGTKKTTEMVWFINHDVWPIRPTAIPTISKITGIPKFRMAPFDVYKNHLCTITTK